MTLNKAHHLYVALIDIRVTHMLKHGVSDTILIDCINRNYKKFLSVKTQATEEEFDQLCLLHQGFGYFRKMVGLLKKKSGACAPLVKDYPLSFSLGTRN